MECAQTKRTPNSTITPPLIDMSKVAMGPEDALQMDIVPFDDPSGGYNAVLTAMDVFSRCLFAYSVVRIDTRTVTRVLTDIITRHCYLPTTIINRHRISIYIRSNATNHQSLGNPAETRYHNTCSDDRYPGKDSHLPQRKSQNHDRGKTHNVAPIPTDGGIELQYLISHILGLRTQQSFHGRAPYNVLDLKYGLNLLLQSITK